MPELKSGAYRADHGLLSIIHLSNCAPFPVNVTDRSSPRRYLATIKDELEDKICMNIESLICKRYKIEFLILDNSGGHTRGGANPHRRPILIPAMRRKRTRPRKRKQRLSLSFISGTIWQGTCEL